MADEYVAPLQKIRDELLRNRREAAKEVSGLLEEHGFLPDKGMQRLVEAHRVMAVLDEMIASEQAARKSKSYLDALA